MSLEFGPRGCTVINDDDKNELTCTDVTILCLFSDATIISSFSDLQLFVHLHIQQSYVKYRYNNNIFI